MDSTNGILLSDHEASELLRIKTRRLTKLARDGKVPCVILPDGELRFSRADLAEWALKFRQLPRTEGAGA